MTQTPYWRSRWLNWLAEVQAHANRRAFPEDPDLANLVAWFIAGRTPADAVAELRTLAAPQLAAPEPSTLRRATARLLSEVERLLIEATGEDFGVSATQLARLDEAARRLREAVAHG